MHDLNVFVLAFKPTKL